MDINSLIQMQKWVNMFANCIMWLMMVYLTDVWGLQFVHAAAIINVWMGFIKVLPIVFAHLTDAFLGYHITVFFSSLSSMIGLGLIWMSTPAVLGNSTGNCTQYKPECIGEQQKQLLYTGLALTAVGIAAHTACYAPVALQQAENGMDENCDFECVICLMGCRINIAAFLAFLVAAFVKPWATLFGICAIFGAISFLVCLFFMINTWDISQPRPYGSPLTTIFRVLFAASSKCFYPQPHDANELYEIPNPYEEQWPHTESLRCLDKAAIVEPVPTLQEQERKRWRLCKVTEVEETKIALRMTSIFMAFIISGVISSLNATYFLEQAKHLDTRVGKAKVPLILFFWFYDHFKRCLTTNFNIIGVVFDINSRYLPRIGIIVAMVYATLSCIVAAKVETRRLESVQISGLIDEKGPMTIFWLLPQFVLLGGHDGIQWLCAYTFSVDQAPTSMIMYFNLFARWCFGLGIMANVVLVYIVGKISEATTGNNWFQSTLNSSRLDNYYWVLAALASLNLVVYVVVAWFYRYGDSRYAQLWEGRYRSIDDYF